MSGSTYVVTWTEFGIKQKEICRGRIDMFELTRSLDRRRMVSRVERIGYAPEKVYRGK